MAGMAFEPHWTDHLPDCYIMERLLLGKSCSCMEPS